MNIAEDSRRPPGFWPLIGILALVPAISQLSMHGLDPDLFWHLRVAEQLLADGIGPLVDKLAFASITTPWTPYSWLAEFVMREIWLAGGYRATLLVQALVVAGIFFFLAAAARQAAPDKWITAACATAIVFHLVAFWLYFRPVTFAIFILSIILWLLYRDRNLGEQSRAVWLVVPLTVLATNIHLFAWMAPIWTGLHWFASFERQESLQRRRRLILFMATVLAACATPMLPGMIDAILHYGTSDPMVSCRDCITELAPLYLKGRHGIIQLILIAAIFLLLVNVLERMTFSEWMFLVVTAAIVINRGRFAPLFAISVLPFLSMSLQGMNDKRLFEPVVVRGVYGLLGLLLLAVIWLMPPARMSMDEWMERDGPAYGYPRGAAAFVEKHITPHHGRLVNEFNWGGYLGWRLGDRFKVLMDGRTQVFPAAFWETVYFGGKEQRMEYLVHVEADAAIVPLGGSWFYEALLDLGWCEAYLDYKSIVLVPAPDYRFSASPLRRKPVSDIPSSSLPPAEPLPRRSPPMASCPPTP